jgi:hypothetical protein
MLAEWLRAAGRLVAGTPTLSLLLAFLLGALPPDPMYSISLKMFLRFSSWLPSTLQQGAGLKKGHVTFI